MNAVPSKPICLLRKPEVLRRTAKCNSSLYAEIAAGKFPAPVKLNADPTSRAVGWIEEEVDAYLAARVAASREQVAA